MDDPCLLALPKRITQVFGLGITLDCIHNNLNGRGKEVPLESAEPIGDFSQQLVALEINLLQTGGGDDDGYWEVFLARHLELKLYIIDSSPG